MIDENSQNMRKIEVILKNLTNILISLKNNSYNTSIIALKDDIASKLIETQYITRTFKNNANLYRHMIAQLEKGDLSMDTVNLELLRKLKDQLKPRSIPSLSFILENIRPKIIKINNQNILFQIPIPILDPNLKARTFFFEILLHIYK